MKRKVTGIGAIACLCLILAACPKVTADQAASGVNKYANTLSAVQDEAIKLHDAKKVSDSAYGTILEAEKVASKAGREMDAGVALAASGADPSQYIALATKSFGDLQAVVTGDANANQGLSLLLAAASSALQNAVSLITQLRQQTAVAPKTSHNMPLAPWTFIPLMGFAFMGGAAGLTAALELLKLLIQLEPAGYDLVMKFANSLKGKSTAEILALNEAIFDKVDATAASEEAKLKNPSA